MSRPARQLLNKGQWPGPAGGKPQALIKPALVEQIFAPHFPNVSKSYGMLTWLGGATADPHNVSCCAPRWGAKATCRGKTLTGAILGDDLLLPASGKP
eukprot:SAG22_NODE_4110_length_1382_cov_1.226033_2_plen_97_part_01